jgi:hypothetical protein
VQREAQRPDIGSAEALKRVLLAAKSVGYSTGPSGAYLAALFESVGIAGDIKAKSRQVPLGATFGGGLGLELASVVWQSDSAHTYTLPTTSFG